MIAKERLVGNFIQAGDWEFEFQQRNEHSLLMADVWCRSLAQEYPRQLNLLIEPLDYLFLSNDKGFVKREQKKKVLALIRTALAKDDTYLQYIFLTTQKRIEQLDAFTSSVVDGDTSEKTELLSKWQEYDAQLICLVPWFYIPWYITEENTIADRVRTGLMKYQSRIESVTDMNNALMVLMYPTRGFMLQAEQHDFYELVALAVGKPDFDNNEAFLQMAKEYLKKYAWMTTYILLPLESLTLEQLIQRTREALRRNSLAEYKQQRQARAQQIVLVEELLTIVAQDKQLLVDIEWARKFAWLLTWSVEKTLEATARMIPTYKQIAQLLGVPYADFSRLTSLEITLGLKGDRMPSPDDLVQRRQGYAFLSEAGETHIMTGLRAQQFITWVDSQISVIAPDQKELRGQPANGGMVQGRVRICLDPGAAATLRQGEILVCSMTSPDYVPAMKRAGAIVTDEGGLLCHAAIVSRELGIPCVVGTKHATQILKDGDMVEIDADKGIVRII